MKSRTNLLKLTLHSFAFALLLMLFGCPGNGNRPEINSATPEPAKGKKTDFDGERAFEYLKKQVEFGPRPPSSPELEKTRAYIIDQLRSFGVNVVINRSGDPATGMRWWGTGSNFRFDRLVNTTRFLKSLRPTLAAASRPPRGGSSRK